VDTGMTRQKRAALAKTQQYLGNSSERKVVSIGQK